MRISDWSSDVCSSDLAALEQWFRIVQYLRVEAVGHRVAEVRPLRSAFLVGRIDLGEQRVEVEIVEMFGAAADLAAQFGAADHLVEAAAAELGENPAHFLGEDGHLVDDLRTEERSVGKDGVSTLSSRWWP